MMIDAATERALDEIARRASDMQRAFTPGAMPSFDDVATAPASRPALDPLSAAPPAQAYFVTSDARGRTSYTQSGVFSVRDGALVDGDGIAVLGFANGAKNAAPLQCDGVDVALGRVKNARIDADGSFVYDRFSVDPRTGAAGAERVVVGRVALARFPAATRLNVTAVGRAAAPPGVAPHVGRPADGSFAALEPMHRSNSRIDFNRSLDRLEEAYVTFDAVVAAHKARGAFGKTAMDLLK